MLALFWSPHWFTITHGMAQPGDFAYQVKQSTEIVRLVGEHVRLKRSGGARYMGLCPFHQEKTPSFSVHGGLQFYHCFGCGASGDVFKFVMETERLTFPEAVRRLAERAGIPLPRARGPEADAEARLRAALLEMHETAAAFFQQRLHSAEGAAVRQYLERRGVSPGMAAEFRLGYAPASGSALLRQLGPSYGTEVLEASGLVLKRDSGGHFDRFRGRLMFPIGNEAGKVIAFGGRALRKEDQPKYLNSPETLIYRKSRVLFNFHRAREGMRRQELVVLVEGYMDALAVFSAGVSNVVASCGTSLTLLQVKALAPLVKTVVVNYDPDAAGAAATERSLSTLLEEGLKVGVLALPTGQDPDQFIRSQGSEAYRAQLEAAPSFFAFLVERARALFDLGSASGRAAAARHILQYINKLPDSMERAELAKDLADRLGLDRQVVGRELSAAAADRRPWSGAAAPNASQYEKELLRVILENPAARSSLLQVLSEADLWADWVTRPIFAALSALDLPSGEALDVTALFDRLEPPDRARLAGIVHQEAVELIAPDKAQQYVEELRRLGQLRRVRERKRRQLATAGSPRSAEEARGQAQIALEINQIDAELNAPHHLLRQS